MTTALHARYYYYLNTQMKGRKPIIYHLNDDIIKSFSPSNVNLLIKSKIESSEIYPREYLFINSNKDCLPQLSLFNKASTCSNNELFSDNG